MGRKILPHHPSTKCRKGLKRWQMPTTLRQPKTLSIQTREPICNARNPPASGQHGASQGDFCARPRAGVWQLFREGLISLETNEIFGRKPTSTIRATHVPAAALFDKKGSVFAPMHQNRTASRAKPEITQFARPGHRPARNRFPSPSRSFEELREVYVQELPPTKATSCSLCPASFRASLLAVDDRPKI